MDYTTADNNALAANAQLAIEDELKSRNILFKEISAVNFSDLNIDIYIDYDDPKHLIGYHKSYYSIGKLRARLLGMNGFDQITMSDFAKLIVDHFEFTKKPKKQAT